MRKAALASIIFFLITSNCLATSHNKDYLEQINNQAFFDINYLKFHSENAQTHKSLTDYPIGTTFGINKTFFRHIYSQLVFNAVQGNLSDGTAASTKTAIFLQQIGARLGYTFFPSSNTSLIPYLTYGHQYWQLDLGGFIINHLTYNGVTRLYQNNFLGMGLLGEWMVSPRWVISADATAGKTFHTWVRYNAPFLKILPDDAATVVYQQSNLSPQPFYQFKLSADYRITPALHGRLGVQYNLFSFSDGITRPSNIVQPKIENTFWNYSAGIAYHFAATESKRPTNQAQFVSNPILAANNQASISFGNIYQNYGETTPDAPYYLDRQFGNLQALGITLNKTFDRIYTQLNLTFGAGTTTYTGFDTDGDESQSSTRNTLFDLTARIGYTFFPTAQTSLTPYVTAGYHRWLRDLRGIAMDGIIVNGYPETYQHTWSGVGLLAQWATTPNWILSVDGNYGITSNAKLNTWCSILSPFTVEQNFNLGSKPIYSIGIGSNYFLSKHWQLLAQVNYTRFEYGISKRSILDIAEPNSKTRLLTTSIGIGYSFD